MDYTAMAEEFFSKTSKMFDGVKRQDISPDLHGEMRILHYIYIQNKAVLPSELSGVTDTSTARIAMALRNLERKGLIERNADKVDRRRVLVTITEQGKSFVEKRRGEVKKLFAMLLNELGEEDAKEYIRITERITEIVKNIRDCGGLDKL